MTTHTTTPPPPPPTPDTPALTLADDSGLVGPKRFGELVAREQGRVDEDGNPKPYTAEIVRIWSIKGYCSAVSKNNRGKLYNPKHAAVAAQNIPTHSRGGARRGSGRKKTKAVVTSPMAERMKIVQDGHDAVAAFKDRIENYEPLPPGEAMEISETLRWTEDEFRKAMAVFTVGPDGISPAKMGVLDKWMSIRERKIKYDKESGKLVEKHIIAETVAQANGPVVEMLESLPAALTDRLSSLSWINEGLVDELIKHLYSALTASGVDTKEPLIHNALNHIRQTLTRPAALDSTIRAVINGEIDGAKQGLFKAVQGNMKHD